jgi:hypothetical protein
MPQQPENISVGTQVVPRVEVRGTNNSLVHPRGAVGVVTRTPAGDEKHSLVRFGARGRIRTCTGDALDVVSLVVGLRRMASHKVRAPGRTASDSLETPESCQTQEIQFRGIRPTNRGVA